MCISIGVNKTTRTTLIKRGKMKILYITTHTRMRYLSLFFFLFSVLDLKANVYEYQFRVCVVNTPHLIFIFSNS